MKRLLIVEDYRRPWSAGHYLAYSAEKIGCHVAKFDPSEPGASEATLLKQVEKEKPTHVLMFKGRGFPAEWNEALKQKGIYTILWHPDVDIHDWMLPLIRSVDYCFTMAEGKTPEWKATGAKRVAWLSQGFEPSFFATGPLTEADYHLYGSDVAFVGNIDSSNRYLYRRHRLLRVLRAGFHLKWWGPRLGRKLINVPLFFSALGRAYGGHFVYGAEFAKVVRCSQIFLAFDRNPEIRLSMSARMYTAVGCGGFYMCESMDGIESVLLPDKEIVTFRGDEEMIDKMQFYLPRTSERQAIARAGQARVLREHTYEKRLEAMFRMISH